MRITPIELAGISSATMAWYSARDHMKPGLGRLGYRAAALAAGFGCFAANLGNGTPHPGRARVRNISGRERRAALRETVAQANASHLTSEQIGNKTGTKLHTDTTPNDQPNGVLQDANSENPPQLSTGIVLGVLGLGVALTIATDRKMPQLLSKLGFSQPHTAWGVVNVLGLLMSIAADESTEFAWK